MFKLIKKDEKSIPNVGSTQNMCIYYACIPMGHNGRRHFAQVAFRHTIWLELLMRAVTNRAAIPASLLCLSPVLHTCEN